MLDFWISVSYANVLKRVLHHLNKKKQEKMLHFEFKSIIASRGYHVCTEAVRSDAKVSDKVKIEIEANEILIAIDPYASAVQSKT